MQKEVILAIPLPVMPKAFLNDMKFDSVTVAPYMGSDSVEPFLAFENKFTIMLALTSNKGGLDFQVLKDQNERNTLRKCVKDIIGMENNEKLMYVVGATRPEFFQKIRNIVPDHFLLVPGVGAQGGDLQGVCQYGLNEGCRASL